MCALAIKAKIIPTTPAIANAIEKLVIISLLDELDSDELDSET